MRHPLNDNPNAAWTAFRGLFPDWMPEVSKPTLGLLAEFAKHVLASDEAPAAAIGAPLSLPEAKALASIWAKRLGA